ncbi:hypothetical protein K438DRAFT_1955714 [Mycena galopus ATCC 62051]|nr:hypothetical protein K438DRAFT_1955714 [Mycena galopus ATCC 62051]
MPPKAKLYAAEEMHRLRDELSKKKKQIAALERTVNGFRAASKKPRLILRPKGQPGRKSNGYNIQHEMKLDHDSTRYHRLYIAEKAIYFRKFDGFWPIHAMISTYLLNMQTRRRQDKKLEKQAENRDAGLVEPDDEDEEMGSDAREDSEVENEEEEAESHAIDSDEEEEEEEEEEIELDKSRKRKLVAAPVDEPPAKKAKLPSKVDKNCKTAPLPADVRPAKNTTKNAETKLKFATPPFNESSDKKMVKSEKKSNKSVKFAASPVQSTNS